MTKNIGPVDRAIRVVVGIALLAAFFLGAVEGALGIIAIVVAVAMLGTAAIGWCAPYTLLGINTGANKDDSASA